MKRVQLKMQEEKEKEKKIYAKMFAWTSFSVLFLMINNVNTPGGSQIKTIAGVFCSNWILRHYKVITWRSWSYFCTNRRSKCWRSSLLWNTLKAHGRFYVLSYIIFKLCVKQRVVFIMTLLCTLQKKCYSPCRKSRNKPETLFFCFYSNYRWQLMHFKYSPWQLRFTFKY